MAFVHIKDDHWELLLGGSNAAAVVPGERSGNVLAQCSHLDADTGELLIAAGTEEELTVLRFAASAVAAARFARGSADDAATVAAAPAPLAPCGITTLERYDGAVLTHVAISPHGQLVAAAHDETVRVFSTGSGAAVASLAGPRAPLCHLSFLTSNSNSTSDDSEDDSDSDSSTRLLLCVTTTGLVCAWRESSGWARVVEPSLPLSHAAVTAACTLAGNAPPSSGGPHGLMLGTADGRILTFSLQCNDAADGAGTWQVRPLGAPVSVQRHLTASTSSSGGAVSVLHLAALPDTCLPTALLLAAVTPTHLLLLDYDTTSSSSAASSSASSCAPWRLRRSGAWLLSDLAAAQPSSASRIAGPLSSAQVLVSASAAAGPGPWLAYRLALSGKHGALPLSAAIAALAATPAHTASSGSAADCKEQEAQEAEEEEHKYDGDWAEEDGKAVEEDEEAEQEEAWLAEEEEEDEQEYAAEGKDGSDYDETGFEEDAAIGCSGGGGGRAGAGSVSWSMPITAADSAAAAAAEADDGTISVLSSREPAADCVLIKAARVTNSLRAAAAAALARAAATPLSLEAQQRATAAGGRPPKKPTTTGSSTRVGGGASIASASASQHIMFHAKVRSSGYGAVAPRKPAWAQSKASGSGSGGSGSGKAGVPSMRKALAGSDGVSVTSGGGGLLGSTRAYPVPVEGVTVTAATTCPAALNDAVFGFGATPDSTTGSYSSGSAGSGRTLQAPTASGARLAAPPVSAAVLPCGPIASLAVSSTGADLAVAAHDKDACLYTAKCSQGPRGVRVSGSSVSRHALLMPALTLSSGSGGSGSSGSGSGSGGSTPAAAASTPIAARCTTVAWSAGTWSGLSSKLVQADPSARRSTSTSRSTAARGGSGGSSGGSSSGLDATQPCRLALACGGTNNAAVWAGSSGRVEPIFVVSDPRGSSGSSGSSSSGSSGTTAAAAAVFSSTVTSGCFYYLDRLMLLSCSDKIHAFSFALDADAAADEEEGSGGGATRLEDATRLKRRYAAAARYAPVVTWQAAEGGSTVTSVAAHNTFRSPLVFAACSDRSVRIFDLAASSAPTEVLRLPDAHTRPVHTLVLPTASSHADVSAASLNCFLTAGTDGNTAGAGLLRLWDLRAARCAQQLYGGHANRMHACGAAISPDVLYVATGSEDRCAVVYDLRKAGSSSGSSGSGQAGGTAAVAARLKGAKDTVTAVAWHPTTPLLFAGSLDGGVRAYSPAAGEGQL